MKKIVIIDKSFNKNYNFPIIGLIGLLFQLINML